MSSERPTTRLIRTPVRPHGQGRPVERGEVAGPVAEDRVRLLGERGEDELAHLAVRHRLERLGVEALHDEVVLLDVHPAPRGALAGDAGADHLGEAVVVERQDPELPLDLQPQLLRPGLAAEVAVAQRELAGAEALLARHLPDVERVGGGADQDLGAEVADQQHLSRRVPAGGRDHGRAHPLDAVVEAEAAGEEAVAEGDVDECARGAARRR